jgi:membrane protein implicated in regulation of membrane protease activity
MVALGLVAIGVALLLLLAEAHLSTGGVIAIGAAIALVCGVALLLIGASAGVLAVVAISAGVGVASIGGLAMIVHRLAPSRHRRTRSGPAGMIGHIGVVRGGDDGEARVFVDGGLWRAQPGPLEETDLHDGDRVVIEHVNGLTLRVRRADELELNP